MRRARLDDSTRRLVRQSRLSADDLILPVFVREGKGAANPIPSMPGVFRHSVDKLLPVVEQALTYGIPAMARHAEALLRAKGPAQPLDAVYGDRRPPPLADDLGDDVAWCVRELGRAGFEADPQTRRRQRNVVA